jgi:hypothetical protein
MTQSGEMQKVTSRPIFVVGSPRSGTSILTWCLGQHPNIFPVPESSWMGDFAINIAIAYQIGAARGERSMLSAMDIREDELFALFGQSINDLIMRHRKDLPWFKGTSTASEPKGRCVDGTPEYSLHICGLRKLFPEALFIHIFRDVTSVVRSMLHFHHVSGQSLVANVHEAYSYWLRTVSRCLLAERAYGPNVVFRIRHSDLVGAPEATLRSVFHFLSEPFAPECLEPLAQRINSSNVPPDFEIDDREVDPSLIEQVRRLCREVEEGSQPLEASAAAIEEIESAFDERVQFMANLPKENQRITARAARLATEVKKKSAIIQRLRASRRHSNWFRYLFRALPKAFQRRKKIKETHSKQMDDPAVSLTNSNQPNDI